MIESQDDFATSVFVSPTYEKLKFKAIIRKYLRERISLCSIAQKLFEYTYFQELQQQLGQVKTMTIILELVKEAEIKEFYGNVTGIN